ncbi:MAG TPA: Ig-like domain repeat protein [Bryobacteraceae bacterium]|nr:Ig-like domain repeat protein [Bryobacteraceae bacterium]
MNVTSRVLPNGGSEALLMIDEPGSGLSGAGPALPQVVCGSTAGAVPGGCVGTAAGASGLYANIHGNSALASQCTALTGGTCTAFGATPNVFMGVVSGNQVTFQGVPVLPPQTTGSRVFRMTNVRMDAATLSLTTAPSPFPSESPFWPVSAAFSASGPGALPIPNPIQTVGFVQSGLTTSVRNAANSEVLTGTDVPQFLKCMGVAAGGPVNGATLRFTEGFANAFKTRVNATPTGSGISANPLAQNLPGVIYANSESGFVLPAQGGTAGLSDFGTRLRAVFSNIPAGINVYVTTTNYASTNGLGPAPNAPGGSPTFLPAALGPGRASPTIAQLVQDESTPDPAGAIPSVAPTLSLGPAGTPTQLWQVPLVNGSGEAVWEVVQADPNVPETLDFGVYYSFTSGAALGVGTGTVDLSYAPAPGPSTASAGPVPRFVDTSGAGTAIVTSSLCQTSVVLSASPTASVYGQPVTFTATMAYVPGLLPPTGDVIFGWPPGTLGKATLDANARAAVTTSSLPAGLRRIDAVYGGGPGYALPLPGSVTVLVSQAPLTVTANYATATAGGPLPRLTASIAGFVNGDGPSVVSGAPVLTTTATAGSPPGNYPITVSAGTLAAANYSFTPVAGTLVLTATPTLGLNAGGNTPAPANTILGQSFMMPPNATPWTGITFNFFSDQGLTPVASGKAYLFSMPYTGTPGGLAALTNPAGTSASAMANAKLRAKKGAARDAAAGFVAVSTGISGGAYVFPPAVTLQPGATYYLYVDTAAGGFPGGIATGGSIAGGVGFAAGGAAAAFAPMAGSANFRVNGVAVAPTSSVTVTSDVNPSTLGQMVTFSATVSGNLAGVPAGAVQFLDGTTVLGSGVLSGGQAVFRTAALTAGSHTIVASYGGGGGLPASQGTMVQNVNALPSAMTLAANPAAPVYGQAVTVTANVAGTAAPAGIAGPTGTVTFYVDATPFARTAAGTASLASGAASVALNGLAVGTHTVLAQYSGDANWAASAAQAALTVAQAATATSVSLAVTGGQLVVTSAVAAAAGAGTPAGTVTFVDTANNTVLASAGLAGGNASAQLAASAAGRPIAAVYAGDANFKGSTSAALPAVTNAASSGAAGFAADEMCSLMGVAGLSGDTAGTLPLASSLGGVTVKITDSAGVARNAPLYGVFGSAGQINFAIPGDTAKGMAAVTVGLAGGGAIATAIGIGAMAPGLFSADATGHGVWAGQAIHVHADGSQTVVASARWDDSSKQWVANPIDLGPEGERVILVVYGTGLRHGSSLAVTTGGTALPVLYWGAQGQYPGLDQVNVELPRGLAGAGAVDLVVSVDGRAANTVNAMVQ